jgi:hypothetical protein
MANENLKKVLSYKRPFLWVIVVAVAAAACLIVAFTFKPLHEAVSSAALQGSTYEGYRIDTLLENKTPYIGDNSKVGALASAVPLPEGIKSGTFALQTTVKPYGLTLHYSMTDSSGIKKAGGITGDAFFRNAAVLLSLIDNADTITVDIVDNTGDYNAAYTFTFTRDMIEKQVGKDVRQYAESETSLKSLIDQIKNLPVSNSSSTITSSTASSKSSGTAVKSDNTVIYKNTQYGFQVTLPQSWKGYTTASVKWNGNQNGKIVESGPIINIRDPKWTAKNPRQAIPIMVFSIDQWNSLQKEKFFVSAAPIPPSELGRNNKYVFALPARYNFAFLPGYEDVEKILNGKPLKAFDIK